MKNVLKAIALVSAGVVVFFILALSALHTVVELEEYYRNRYD